MAEKLKHVDLQRITAHFNVLIGVDHVFVIIFLEY